jgi:hypothetical protein
MPELKLGKLPDRKPVKITITVSAALDKKLHSYAEAYRAAYSEDEKVNDLIPFMIEQFLDGDRGFAKTRREKEPASDGPVARASGRTGPKRRDSQPSTVS